MPNWCSNTIVITPVATFAEVDFDVLKKKFDELLVSHEPVMEMLLGKEDRPADYDDGGWYDYNVNKFGTKWDFNLDEGEGDFEIEDECITLRLDTAWAPPLQFLETLSIMYKVRAEIRYAEPGGDFAGKMIFAPDGIELHEEYSFMEGSYRNDDTFWDDVEFYQLDGVSNSWEDVLQDFPYITNEDDIAHLKEVYDRCYTEPDENDDVM